MDPGRAGDAGLPGTGGGGATARFGGGAKEAGSLREVIGVASRPADDEEGWSPPRPRSPDCLSHQMKRQRVNSGEMRESKLFAARVWGKTTYDLASQGGSLLFGMPPVFHDTFPV